MSVDAQFRLVPRRLARGDIGFAERGWPAQQIGTRLQIGGVELPFWDRHEIAVGEVALAVGEGEAGGGADQPVSSIHN